MGDVTEQDYPIKELSDDDRIYIRDTFFREIVPKLRKLDARLGTLNCEFAGKRYGNWNIRFESAGSDFDIMEFEYDEEGLGLDLDL